MFPLSHVSDYIGALQSGAANNVEDMRARLDPYFAQVRDNAQAKMTTLNDLLMSHVDSVKTKIQTTAEDIQDRFEESADDLRSTMEGKMEELRSWFQPYISMISDNL